MIPPDPGFSAGHPSAPTSDWDAFEVDTGSANVSKRLEESGFGGRTAKQAFILADDNNSADVSVGPDQAADLKPIGGGGSFQLPSDGNNFTIGNWWVKSASANQKVKVLYV